LYTSKESIIDNTRYNQKRDNEAHTEKGNMTSNIEYKVPVEKLEGIDD